MIDNYVVCGNGAGRFIRFFNSKNPSQVLASVEAARDEQKLRLASARMSKQAPRLASWEPLSMTDHNGLSILMISESSGGSL